MTKTDAGAHWLLDPEKVYEMVAAVTDAVSKPVTVKMRTGWDEKHVYAVQNALAAERGGAAALAMHGRTRKTALCWSCGLEHFERSEAAPHDSVHGQR